MIVVRDRSSGLSVFLCVVEDALFERHAIFRRALRYSVVFWCGVWRCIVIPFYAVTTLHAVCLFALDRCSFPLCVVSSRVLVRRFNSFMSTLQFKDEWENVATVTTILFMGCKY